MAKSSLHKGASSENGEAIARHLSAQGAYVVLGAQRIDRLRSSSGELARSGRKALAQKVPMAQVILAFNMVPGEVLFPVFQARPRASKPTLVFCGAIRTAKQLMRS